MSSFFDYRNVMQVLQNTISWRGTYVFTPESYPTLVLILDVKSGLPSQGNSRFILREFILVRSFPYNANINLSSHLVANPRLSYRIDFPSVAPSESQTLIASLF